MEPVPAYQWPETLQSAEQQRRNRAARLDRAAETRYTAKHWNKPERNQQRTSRAAQGARQSGQHSQHAQGLQGYRVARRAASDASEKRQIPRKAARIQANQQQRAPSRTKPSRAARVASAEQRAAPAAPARKATRSRVGVPRGKRAARRVGGCLA